MTSRDIPEKFLVSFSLAGEQRELVRAIAEAVERELGESTVFFDEWFEHYISGLDSDVRLQEIYNKRTILDVVCISGAYNDKPWTKVEHRAIRARVMECDEALHVLPIRVGDGEIVAASKGLHLDDYVWDLAKVRTNKADPAALKQEVGREKVKTEAKADEKPL